MGRGDLSRACEKDGGRDGGGGCGAVWVASSAAAVPVEGTRQPGECGEKKSRKKAKKKKRKNTTKQNKTKTKKTKKTTKQETKELK